MRVGNNLHRKLQNLVIFAILQETHSQGKLSKVCIRHLSIETEYSDLQQILQF